jgi:hypothetical protein
MLEIKSTKPVVATSTLHADRAVEQRRAPADELMIRCTTPRSADRRCSCPPEANETRICAGRDTKATGSSASMRTLFAVFRAT